MLAFSGALSVPAASIAADEVTTFQANTGHDGFSTAVAPTLPLMLDWKRELGVRTSYPVVADGRVFVTANDDVYGFEHEGDGATLYALDIETGQTLWARWIPDMSAPTYDDGRVILTSSGYTGVYDAATGRVLTVGRGGSPYTPVARAGRIYGTNVIDIASATSLWGTESDSVAAVDDDSYYLADECGPVTRIDAFDGHEIWADELDCSGGGRNPVPVLHDGELWARDLGHDELDLIFDAETGARRGGFSSAEAPAFAGDTVLLVDEDGTLTARDRATQAVRWVFEGGLRGPPLIVGSTVYGLSADSHLYALDLATGAVLWDQDHDGRYWAESSDSAQSGLAVADGRLFAPINGGLYAYGNTGGGLDPGAPPDPGATAEVAELPPLEPPGDSIGYRGNPAHTGFINTSAPAPPVRPVWSYGDLKGWEMPRDQIQPLVADRAGGPWPSTATPRSHSDETRFSPASIWTPGRSTGRRRSLRS